MSDKLLTAEQVAVLLGTTPRHVRRLVFVLGRRVPCLPAQTPTVEGTVAPAAAST